MPETTTDKIADLRELKEAGAITQAEFNTMRDALLRADVLAPEPHRKSVRDRAPAPTNWAVPRDEQLPVRYSDATKVVRFMHFGLGVLAVLGGGFSVLAVIPVLASGETGAIFWLLGTAFWTLVGVAQIAVAAKMDGKTPSLYGPSLAIAVLYVMTCSIFGFILAGLHLTPDVKRDLQEG